MIGSIRGTLIDKSPPWIQVDCGGIGYEIEVPMSTYYHLPELQSDIFLHIYMVVREDAQLLFDDLADWRMDFLHEANARWRQRWRSIFIW